MAICKVKGSSDLVKNINTNVVQNSNKEAYLAYIKRRDAELQTKERINKLEKTLQDTNDKLDRILTLLNKD